MSYKTIAQLLPADFEQRNRLGEFLDMTVDQYIRHWENVRQQGARIPALFNRVLDIAIREREAELTGEQPLSNNPEQLHANMPELNTIDITELLFYFTDKSDSIAVNRLRSGGITSLGLLISSPHSRLRHIPYIGTSTLLKAYQYKNWLIDNYLTVLSATREVNNIIIVPADYNAAMPLLPSIRDALCTIGRIMDKRCDNPRFVRSARDNASMQFMADILRLRYCERLPFATIAKRLGRTAWHVTKSHYDFVRSLLDGDTVCINVRLDPDIIDRVRRIQDDSLFRECDDIGPVTELDETLLSIIGIAMLEVAPGLLFSVPAGNKCRFASKCKTVMKALRDNVVPLQRDELMGRILGSPDFSRHATDQDERFANAIITHPGIAEADDEDNVRLHLQHFISDEQRIARIIYDHRGWLTRSEIAERYENIFGRKPHSVNLSNLRKYGIHSSGDMWTYGRRLDPISRAIINFAEERRIFHMDELEASLRESGYPIVPRIRAYITTQCLVDNMDSNHFCHKAYADDYPQYSWRRPGRTGLTNWVLNCVNNYIAKQGRASIADICDHVEREAIADGKQQYIRSRVKNILPAYSGPDKPFLIDREMVTINPAVHATTNFRTIGRRGQAKTPVFELIRNAAIEMLSASPDGKVKLVDFLRHMSEIAGEPINRNKVVRALTHKHMGDLPLELTNIDGVVYLVSHLAY